MNENEFLVLIAECWKRFSDEQDEKIEKLKELVIKQTKTAARLDPRHKETQRINQVCVAPDYHKKVCVA